MQSDVLRSLNLDSLCLKVIFFIDPGLRDRTTARLHDNN